jgi:hypothetical protein
MLVDDVLVLAEMLGDLLSILVLRDPEPLDLELLIQIPDARDVVIVRVGYREDVELLAPVAAIGQDILKQFEDIDPIAGTPVDIDEHESAVWQLEQSAISLPDVRKDHLQIRHRHQP